MRQANKTIMLFSGFVLLALALMILTSFGIIGSKYNLLTSTGAGIITIIGGIALLLETYMEGKSPNMNKDYWAWLNTIFGISAIIFAIILFTGVTMSTTWTTVLGVVYVLIWILLAKELFFD